MSRVQWNDESLLSKEHERGPVIVTQWPQTSYGQDVTSCGFPHGPAAGFFSWVPWKVRYTPGMDLRFYFFPFPFLPGTTSHIKWLFHFLHSESSYLYFCSPVELFRKQNWMLQSAWEKRRVPNSRRLTNWIPCSMKIPDDPVFHINPTCFILFW